MTTQEMEIGIAADAATAPGSDRAIWLSLAVFVAVSLAVGLLFAAFPGLWSGFLAAYQELYESRVVMSILCRP